MKNKINIAEISISIDGTHHIYQKKPLYTWRFNKVLSFHHPGYAPVEDDTGAYYIDVDGNPVCKMRFLKVYGYYENLSTVCSLSGYYHIDTNFEPIYDERYAWAGNFQEGVCTVRDKNRRYFHIDRKGNRIYQQSYRYAGDYKYGIASVYLESGEVCHIDKKGERINEETFLELDVFHKGFARARDKDGCFHINKSGKPAYYARFEWVEPYYNDQALVCKGMGEVYVIDEIGNNCNQVRDESHKIVRELNHEHLMDMLVGHWKTQIISSLVQSGIIEAINTGKNTHEILKVSLGFPEQSVHMMLNVLRIWGMVKEKNGIYELTHLGKMLIESSDDSLKYASLMWSSEHYHVMEKLLVALKDFTPQFEDVFGLPFFDYLVKNPERGNLYNKALSEYTVDYSPLLDLYDFPHVKTVLDVGGGTGKLLAQILKKNSYIEKGILFDLPSVISEVRTELKDYSNLNIELIQGNFFTNPLPETDTIIMSRVLHDWDDQKAAMILENAQKSLQPGGKLILFEMVIPELPEADIGVTLNFNLLVMVGGKERTAKEFELLLNETGFYMDKIISGDGIISMVICSKIGGYDD